MKCLDLVWLSICLKNTEKSAESREQRAESRELTSFLPSLLLLPKVRPRVAGQLPPLPADEGGHGEVPAGVAVGGSVQVGEDHGLQL